MTQDLQVRFLKKSALLQALMIRDSIYTVTCGNNQMSIIINSLDYIISTKRFYVLDNVSIVCFDVEYERACGIKYVWSSELYGYFFFNHFSLEASVSSFLTVPLHERPHLWYTKEDDFFWYAISHPVSNKRFAASAKLLAFLRSMRGVSRKQKVFTLKRCLALIRSWLVFKPRKGITRIDSNLFKLDSDTLLSIALNVSVLHISQIKGLLLKNKCLCYRNAQ